MKWVITILITYFVGVIAFLVHVHYANEPIRKFVHECELDQGISVHSNSDEFCIYPKENKIVRFAN